MVIFKGLSSKYGMEALDSMNSPQSVRKEKEKKRATPNQPTTPNKVLLIKSLQNTPTPSTIRTEIAENESDEPSSNRDTALNASYEVYGVESTITIRKEHRQQYKQRQQSKTPISETYVSSDSFQASLANVNYTEQTPDKEKEKENVEEHEPVKLKGTKRSTIKVVSDYQPQHGMFSMVLILYCHFIIN